MRNQWSNDYGRQQMSTPPPRRPTLPPSLSPTHRRAQEDRKIRAAEEVILATKSRDANSDQPGGDYTNFCPGHQHPIPQRGRLTNFGSTTTTTGTTSAAAYPASDDDDEHDSDSGSSGGASGGSDDAGLGVWAENRWAEYRGAGGGRGKIGSSPRRFAEEELDRYCEATLGKKAALPLLKGFRKGSVAASKGVRRTPRRVPIRPETSGRGGSSPRTVRGQLVVSQSLSAR